MSITTVKWTFSLGVCLAIMGLSLALRGDEPDFGPPENRGPIAHDALREISGMAASQRNPGILWLHNDSGDSNRLFAIDTQGRHRGIFHLCGAANRDWEDICLGPGPDSLSYIYVGDIGDNAATYPEKVIYRVPEPLVPPGGAPPDTLLNGVAAIRFRLPDGPRDAETLMIDPPTGDIYIVSKREPNVRVYRLPYPQSPDSTLTAEAVAALPFSFATAGDISPDGREILIKNYAQIFYWCRAPGASIGDVLAQPPLTVPYAVEPQGEALCWDAAGSGYFTTSEEFADVPAELAYYPRQPTGIPGSETPAVRFQLAQNYPNPFNPRTEIVFALDVAGDVSLRIYNAAGQLLQTLLHQKMPAGEHRVVWDGRAETGETVAAGIYFYHLRVGPAALTRKMSLIR